MGNPIAFAWVASALYGIQGVAGKLMIKYAIKNPWQFNFFWNALILIMMAPIALYFGAGVPERWGIMIITAILQAIVTITYVYLLYLFDASIVGSLYNFRTAIGPIFGVLWLGEILTGYQFVLIALIFIGGMLLTMDERFSIKSFFRPAMLVALAAVVASTAHNAFIKIAAQEHGFWTMQLWMMLIAQVVLCLTIPMFWREIRSTPGKSYLPVFVLAIISTAADLTANYALSDNISISGAILALPFSMLFAIILSRIAPQLLEKHTWKVYTVRILAGAVMFFAAIKLS